MKKQTITRKVLSLVLAVFIVASLGATMVFASDADVDFAVGGTNATTNNINSTVGSTVPVYVHITTPNSGISAMMIRLNYDETRLSLAANLTTTVTAQSVLDYSDMSNTEEAPSNYIKYANAISSVSPTSASDAITRGQLNFVNLSYANSDDGGLILSGKILKINFVVKPGATGVIPLTLTVNELKGQGGAFLTSSVTNATITLPSPPAAPTNLAKVGERTATSVDLSWTAAATATGYNVYNGATKVNATPITGTTYTVSGLSAATEYSFTVKAINANGESAASSALVVAAMATDPVITSLVADTVNKTLLLTVDNVNASDVYQVWLNALDANGNSIFGNNLVKAYADNFTSFSVGTATLSIPVDSFANSYTVQIRSKASLVSGTILATVTKDDFTNVAMNILKLGTVTVNGTVNNGQSLTIAKGTTLNIVATANGSADIQYAIEKYKFGNVIETKANSTDSLFFAEEGTYVVKVTASAGVQSESLSFTVNVYDSSIVNAKVSGLNLNAHAKVGYQDISATGSNPGNALNGILNYNYVVAASGKTIYNSGYNMASGFGYNFLQPGIYSVTAFVKRPGSTLRYEDGAKSYITITRANGTLAKISGYDVTGGSSQVGDVITVNPVGNEYPALTISAAGSGLGDSQNLYKFKFDRADSLGDRLVQNWGTSDLNWTPARPGTYNITVSVQGTDNTGYAAESYKTITFKVMPRAIDAQAGITGATLNVAPAATAGAGQIYNITANANETGLRYAFDVIDPTLGVMTIQGFSFEKSLTWIPRKTGTYTIITRINDPSSSGYYDVTSSETVVVE